MPARKNTHQLDVVDHPIHAVGLAHQGRHVQSAQAEQRRIEENLRQLPRPQLPAEAAGDIGVAIIGMQRKQKRTRSI